MLTANVKGGIFTYCYRIGGKTKVTIRAPKDAIKLVIPYLESKTKKAAH